MHTKHQVKITYTLIVLCLVVAIWTNAGDTEHYLDRITQLTIVSPQYLHVENMWHFPFWRFITPILIHFGLMHLIFNLTNWYALGSAIEQQKGSWFLAVFVLITALISNFAQLYLGHSPDFGGLSGVVYAVLGYLWIAGHYHPDFYHLKLSQNTIIVMLGWLILCWTGLLGPVANWTHLAGLIVGALWAAIESLLKRSLRKPV